MRRLLVTALLLGCLAAAVAPGRAEPVVGSCPVTRPNGMPPAPGGESGWVGNGRLATAAYQVIVARPADVDERGWIARKFGWRGRRVAGELRIAGRRLDAPAPALRGAAHEASVPGAPPGTRLWGSTVRFPTPGCWRVTGAAGSARLSLLVFVQPL